MADFFAACRARMPAFTPAGFASMIHSVARLGYWPGGAFMAAFEAEVMKRGLDNFSRGELWKLAHGLASLRHRPDDAFLAAYFRAFSAKAGRVDAGQGKLTVKDVSLVLWSMAALDAGPPHAPALAALVDAAAALVARHQLEPQDDEYPSRSGGDDPAVLKYRQLVQAGMYLRSLGDPAVDAALDRLDAALQAAWRPKMGGQPQPQPSQPQQQPQQQRQRGGEGEGEGEGARPSVTASPTPTFHAAVLELLDGSGVNVETGTLNDVFNIELLLFPVGKKSGRARERGEQQQQALAAAAEEEEEEEEEGEEKPVVLLLEGRGHFFTNALGRQTGDAEFRRRLAEHAAHVQGRFKAVGQVTIWEWRAAKSGPGRLRLLRSRLRSLGVDPDAYIRAPRGEREGEREGDGEEVGAVVHHVAVEVVGGPGTEGNEQQQEVVCEAAHAADVVVQAHEHGGASPAAGEARKGHGPSQRRRGGKRRIVAAALRASKAASAGADGGAGAASE
jgi:hypothetical protein